MKPNLLFFLIISFLGACSGKNNVEIHPEFKSYFDEYKVEGCFLLYDFQKNKTLIYNENRCNQGFLPASTFKIVNSLIGIETGIITGENFVIPWDSVVRQIPAWNREHNLASAFRNSVVPWYQELARRIGTGRMQNWVTKARFGEMDIQDENIDLFWLTGNSSITPFEQLDFQKRLIKNDLPFSQPTIDLVKKIMIIEKTPGYIFRGKTGWATMGEKNVGWLVGYFEKGNSIYAYVVNVESGEEDASLFQKSREGITRKILKKLSLM